MSHSGFPFNPDEDERPDVPISAILSAWGGGDSLTIFGRRTTPISIRLEKTSEFSPVEDAIILEAILSACLPAETIHALATYLYQRHLHPFTQEAQNMRDREKGESRKKSTRKPEEE